MFVDDQWTDRCSKTLGHTKKVVYTKWHPKTLALYIEYLKLFKDPSTQSREKWVVKSLNILDSPSTSEVVSSSDAFSLAAAFSSLCFALVSFLLLFCSASKRATCLETLSSPLRCRSTASCRRRSAISLFFSRDLQSVHWSSTNVCGAPITFQTAFS